MEIGASGVHHTECDDYFRLKDCGGPEWSDGTRYQELRSWWRLSMALECWARSGMSGQPKGTISTLFWRRAVMPLALSGARMAFQASWAKRAARMQSWGVVWPPRWRWPRTEGRTSRSWKGAPSRW